MLPTLSIGKPYNFAHKVNVVRGDVYKEENGVPVYKGMPKSILKVNVQ